MPEIKLTNITKRWGKFYAVDNLNLHIENNSFITILGPSGCGLSLIHILHTLQSMTQIQFHQQTDSLLDVYKRQITSRFGQEEENEMLQAAYDIAQAYLQHHWI